MNMKNWKFYHGTSEEIFKSIKKDGLILDKPHFFNWLSARGIYFVINRPLIARRFAKRAARLDRSKKSVVLEFRIIHRKLKRILDLTTDAGMNRFFEAYEKGLGLSSIDIKLNSNISDKYKGYLTSILNSEKDVKAKLDEANNVAINDSRVFNWDTYAIESIVIEDDIQMIIAAIHDGNTFNEAIKRTIYSDANVPHYHGIRCRDHIEICVCDLSILDMNNILQRPRSHDDKEFNEDFVNMITDLNAPDSVH